MAERPVLAAPHSCRGFYRLSENRSKHTAALVQSHRPLLLTKAHFPPLLRYHSPALLTIVGRLHGRRFLPRQLHLRFPCFPIRRRLLVLRLWLGLPLLGEAQQPPWHVLQRRG
ncbi:hypothetical protein GUJ93_ZPchr0006g46047 [Zizania palustris]|uniref:Uncharacterized protein n=1 Tax=Zizania palustris TaxID=103762 RepID=A0A8J5SUV6_ZIZPA|nr:hypothetical protein GUJ93_ZPchr0006g46047 [Zizania palustris]